MTQSHFSARGTFVPQPDFTSVFWLSVTTIACYVCMIASAMSGSVMVIYFVLLLPVFAGLVGGTVGVLCRKLRIWQIDCEKAHPGAAPTIAQIETARLAKGAMWACLGTCALMLFLFLMQDEVGSILTFFPMMSFGYGWFRLTLLKDRRTRSQNGRQANDPSRSSSVPLVRRRPRANLPNTTERPDIDLAHPVTSTSYKALSSPTSSYDRYLEMLKRQEELRTVKFAPIVTRVLICAIAFMVLHVVIGLLFPGSVVAGMTAKLFWVALIFAVVRPGQRRRSGTVDLMRRVRSATRRF